jgi:hypothetical protein
MFTSDWFPIHWLPFLRFGPLSSKPYHRWVSKACYSDKADEKNAQDNLYDDFPSNPAASYQSSRLIEELPRKRLSDFSESAGADQSEIIDYEGHEHKRKKIASEGFPEVPDTVGNPLEQASLAETSISMNSSEHLQISPELVQSMNEKEFKVLQDLLQTHAARLDELRKQNELKRREMKLMKITKLLELYSKLERYTQQREALGSEFAVLAADQPVASSGDEADRGSTHSALSSNLFNLAVLQEKRLRCLKDLEGFDC